MKNSVKNTLLSLTVTGLLYGVLELWVLPIFYYTLPLRANPLLDDGLPVLLQNTKGHLIPEHYIALAGDSYAMGLGDGYYHAADKARARYGCAAFIQQDTGKDVISFGSAGNGSIAGIVTEPLSTLAYWQASARAHLPAPDTLLVFFYEGNDLNDNVEYLEKIGKKYQAFDNTRINDHKYFQPYIKQAALNQDALYQRSQYLHWYDELYLAKFIWRSVAPLITKLKSQLIPSAQAAERSPLNPPGRFEWTEPGTLNQVIINDAIVQLPDTLQGPSMDLTEAEKNLALVSFREALYFLKNHLPDTQLVVVYIPSVITTYDIRSSQVSVQSHARRQQFIYNTPAVKQQSDEIAQQIQTLSEAEQIPFIDARPVVRRASQTNLLHGPLDWNHFNDRGYQALADAILQQLASY